MTTSKKWVCRDEVAHVVREEADGGACTTECGKFVRGFVCTAPAIPKCEKCTAKKPTTWGNGPRTTGTKYRGSVPRTRKVTKENG